MPIDPMIANPAQLKINDPMEQYGNFLRLSQVQGQMDKARRDADQSKVYNSLIAEHTNDKGITNWSGVKYGAAQRGMGELIPGISKEEGERAELAAKTSKLGVEASNTEMEAIGKFFEQSKNQLLGIDYKNPAVGVQQYAKHLAADMQHPLMAKFLRDKGMSPEQAMQMDIAEAQQAYKGGPDEWANFVLRKASSFEKIAEQHYQTTNLGNRSITTASPRFSLGTPKRDIIATDTMGSSPDAGKNAPKVSVNVAVNAAGKGVNKFMEGTGEALSKEAAELRKTAQIAEGSVERFQEMQRLLQNGKVITGAPAELAPKLLSLAKAMGVDLSAADQTMLNDTQTLQTMIAQTSLNRIAKLHSSGVVLTPMSDSDRAFLQEAGTNKFHDKETMVRLLRIEEDEYRKARQSYNKRVNELHANPYTSEGVKALSLNPMPDLPAPKYPSQKPKPAQQSTQGRGISHLSFKQIQQIKERLSQNPHLVGEFDREYGEGMAKRILGGK